MKITMDGVEACKVIYEPIHSSHALTVSDENNYQKCIQLYKRLDTDESYQQNISLGIYKHSSVGILLTHLSTDTFSSQYKQAFQVKVNTRPALIAHTIRQNKPFIFQARNVEWIYIKAISVSNSLIFVGIDIYAMCVYAFDRYYNLPIPDAITLDVHHFYAIRQKQAQDAICRIGPKNHKPKLDVDMQFKIRTSVSIEVRNYRCDQLCLRHTEIIEINKELGVQYTMTWPTAKIHWDNFLSDQSVKVHVYTQKNMHICQHCRPVVILIPRSVENSVGEKMNLEYTSTHLNKR